MTKKNNALRHVQRAVLAPYGAWALLFIVVPLFFVAYYAFTDSAFHFTTENITRFFTAKSQVSTESGGTKEVYTYLLIFWRLIRTYAWMTILQDTGILNRLLARIGLGPVHIIGTETAVVIGMVYDYFPYMILPIYSVMAKLDMKLVEAAKDLGCNGFNVMRRVIFPLSLPGVISGITMVLIPSISTFYISQKLGNGKFYLIGDAIEGQYVANNLHFAAAIALLLMIVLLVCMALMQRYANKKAVA